MFSSERKNGLLDRTFCDPQLDGYQSLYGLNGTIDFLSSPGGIWLYRVGDFFQTPLDAYRKLSVPKSVQIAGLAIALF